MPARGVSGRARKIPSSAATEGDSSLYLRRFGLGFFGVCTSTRRVTVAPLLPAGETLVSCKRFDTLFVRSELKSRLGNTKRTSLLPLRSDAVPRFIEPSSACSVGAGSVVGAEITDPMACAPGGGSLAVAGFVLNTATEPLTVNSRPSRPRVPFGSER